MISSTIASRGSAPAQRRAAGYIQAACVIAAVKFLFVLLDPNPRFFLWDSVTYLQGALDGPLPRDRSFLYSLLIHAFAVPSHSLQGLVLAQTLAGAATAFLVFVMLRRFVALPQAPALFGALLVAIAPSQLFYEHMVMAEAFGGLLWIAFVALIFAYLRDGRARWLPAIAIAGIVTIAFRLNGTIVIILAGICAPLARAAWLRSAAHPLGSDRRRVLKQMALAAACTLVLHVGYRHVVAEVAHTPPGYIGTEGLFLLGFVAPAVRAQDLRGTGCDPQLLDHVGIAMSDPRNRERQLWSEGGIWSVMKRECPRPEAAATTVADRAFGRILPYLLPMAWSTATQYFDETEGPWRMQADIGRKMQLPLELIDPVKKYFYLDVGSIAFSDTLSSVWFERSRWWLTGCFFLAPLMAGLLYVTAPRGRRGMACKMLASILFGLFLCQFLLQPIVSFRYLHPFPPLMFMGAVVLAFARVLPAWRAARRRFAAQSRPYGELPAQPAVAPTSPTE